MPKRVLFTRLGLTTWRFGVTFLKGWNTFGLFDITTFLLIDNVTFGFEKGLVSEIRTGIGKPLVVLAKTVGVAVGVGDNGGCGVLL